MPAKVGALAGKGTPGAVLRVNSGVPALTGVSVLLALNPANTSPEAVAAGQAAITAYLTAKGKRRAGAPLTPTETALLDPGLNPTIGYNLDAWDGYLAAA
jgi:hypothetical protein